MVRSGSVWLNTGLMAVEMQDVCGMKSKESLNSLYGVGSFRIVSLNTKILRKEPQQSMYKIRLKDVQNIFVCINRELINQ